MTLIPCSDVSAAEWITADDHRWQQLISFGPRGFPAYARLRFIPDPTHEGQRENDVEPALNAPAEAELLRSATQILARHTRTAEDCYFCLWDGWGWNVRAAALSRTHEPMATPSFPQVVLPNRAYYLFRGKLSDLGNWATAQTDSGSHLGMPDPAFIWPADHTWCIANDVDPHWAGIGADTPAIQDLLESRLDVVPADPRRDQPHYR